MSIRLTVFFILFLNTIFLRGNDTLLIGTFNNRFRINNIVVDTTGNVYFSDRNGVHQYLEGKSVLIDDSYKEVLRLEEGKLAYYQDLKSSHKKIQVYFATQPNEWLKFMPILDANHQITVDRFKNHVFVSYKNSIYEYKIEPNFKRVLKGISVRRILKKEKELLVGTYSGGFIGDSLLTPEVLDGFIFDNGKEVIFGGGRFLYRYLSPNGEKIRVNFLSQDEIQDLFSTEIGDFTEVLLENGHYYIATDNGLYIYDSSKNDTTYLFKNTTIHNLVQLSYNYYAVCTDNGVFLGNLESGFNQIDLGELGIPNDLIQIGDKTYLTTSEGFFEVKNRQSNQWKVQPLIFDYPSEFEFYQMEMGIDGCLWVSSENGLYRYQTLSDTYNYFYKGYEFNKRASYNAGKSLYFGGVFGLIEIDMEMMSLDNANYLTKYHHSEENLDTEEWLPFVFVGLLGLGIYLLIYYLHKNKKAKIEYPNETHSQPNSVENDEKVETIKEPLDVLKQCEVFINQNISSVTVSKLAEYLNLSERTLARKLEIVGKTPGELIRDARMDLIKIQLKENPNIDLENLSHITGYSSNHIQNLLKEFLQS